MKMIQVNLSMDFLFTLYRLIQNEFVQVGVFQVALRRER